MKILLEQIMYSKNVSLRQLSSRTGGSKSTIQRIANNEISPRLDTLEKLAIGLKCRMTDLFESEFK
jgi:transcriptional regulator with XRE-family HTH domain